MHDNEQRTNTIWYPYTQMKNAPEPIAISRGEGAVLFDDRGNAYIDAIASWWVNLHGHAHPYVADRVHAQLLQLEHVIFAGFTHRPALDLAEKLLAILPRNQARVFFSDDGSTAVEVALKMALQYWHNVTKKEATVIAMEHAYHGDTFGAMAVSDRGAFVKPFESKLFAVARIPAPVAGRESASLDALHAVLRQNQASVFIFEPLVQGAGGMRMYEPGPLEKMLELCQAYRAVTIADEVMTGFGRTGRDFASDYLPLHPDLVCLSKGLTGGTLPLGVTSCSAEIYNAFLSEDQSRTLFHGHSFAGNPVGCAAGLASLELLQSTACQESIRRIQQQHETIAERFATHPAVRDVRQRGVILAIEVATGRPTSYFNTIRDALCVFFLKQGVLLRPLGNVIYVLPPYCITDIQLHRTYDVIWEALNRIDRGALK